jgi:hypothetical protein
VSESVTDTENEVSIAASLKILLFYKELLLGMLPYCTHVHISEKDTVDHLHSGGEFSDWRGG